MYQDEVWGFHGESIYPYNEELGLYDAGELGGTCAIEIEEGDNIDQKLKIMKGYSGKNLYLIAGELHEYGNDPEETIIKNATLVAKL